MIVDLNSFGIKVSCTLSTLSVTTPLKIRNKIGLKLNCPLPSQPTYFSSSHFLVLYTYVQKFYAYKITYVSKVL